MPYVMLVVDTENYSGNFEREMCAYATGQLNEHTQSDHDRLAQNAAKEIAHIKWWNSNIRYVHHEEYENVVTQIWPTEGWFNNGLGGHYPDDGTRDAEALAVCSAYAKGHYGKEIAKLQARINNDDYLPALGWTKEACIKSIATYQQIIEDSGKIVRKCPSYQSVAISVDVEPPADVMDEFKKRVKYFCENYSTLVRFSREEKLTLTGFRIIQK